MIMCEETLWHIHMIDFTSLGGVPEDLSLEQLKCAKRLERKTDELEMRTILRSYY